METATFTVNGVEQTVNVRQYSTISLAKYLREVIGLTGTKVSCGEGGCGACIVTVSKGPGEAPRAVNSCLSPVPLCHGWSITTVEGLGDKAQGYHPIQLGLAANGGTQCGYCSPGMVMQLHSFLQEHPEATMEQIDNILDGNICRCTGYRPILEAFQKFGSNAPGAKERVAALVADIEDMGLGGEGATCKRTGKACPGAGQCGAATPGCHVAQEGVWYQPGTEQELTQILASFQPSTKYRIVGGNTGTGVFKHDEESYDAFVNINQVAELKQQSQDPMWLGANNSITDAIKFFEVAGEREPKWTAAGHHLSLIASVGIRNQGTLAGNLMMKHAHQDFPSDVFLTMETMGALLDIVEPNGKVETYSVAEFLAVDMVRKYISRIVFPPSQQGATKKRDINTLWKVSGPSFVPNSNPKLPAVKAGPQWFIRTFKIMPRSSNAHAYVNAGFLALVDVEDGYRITQKPRVVFGGIREDFVHATGTEAFLEGKSMADHATFEEALLILVQELQPSYDPSLTSVDYRKQLAAGLFYKFFLHVLGDSASEAVRSGAVDLERGLTSGTQSFETDSSQYPVSQPVEKVEAKWQTAGEAEFVADIPEKMGELHAAFVLSSLANATVVNVNTTRALATPGVVAFVDASDIPGVNNWKFNETPEEIFCTGTSKYAGQALGLILAESREVAMAAARKVQVEYTSLGAVVVEIAKAMEAPSNVVSAGPPMEYGDVDGAMAAADQVVSGRFEMGAQYHFHMETQVAIVTPVEDGFDVATASQDLKSVQYIAALALGLPAHAINPTIRRLGGSYGAKIVLPNHLVAAAAVAANKLHRPVRLWLPLEDNMRMLGKRNQYLFDYRMGITGGKIQSLVANLYCDGGWSMSDVDSYFAAFFGVGSYKVPAARMSCWGVRLDTAPPTSTRAPGMCNGHAMIESIIQHAACEVGISPLEMREQNLCEQGDPCMPPPSILSDPSPIADMITKIKIDADWTGRRQAVDAFNAANLWKKRGMSMVPMRYPHLLSGFGLKMNCLISIFGMDGTISVAHNGIEMGQGMNTKVVQCVAHTLGVPMDLIQCKPVTAVTNPNGMVTGGSCGSESNCVAAIAAAEMIKARLVPAKEKLGPKATWQEIIMEANSNNVDLCAHYMMNADGKDNYPGYQVWGASITEVEVDILTGEQRIVRTDIMEDTGLSTSPIVDVGQVEGAFVMGLGMWTSEAIKYHPETGELLTMNTWEYKPPAAKDIPQDFRVHLIKNNSGATGVLSSKATGEPALLMSISVLFALWDALDSSRRDGGSTGWWQLNGPATVEAIHQHAGVMPDRFIF